MMLKAKNPITFLILIVLLFFAHSSTFIACSKDHKSSGFGSETTNGIAISGQVQYASHRPANQTTVRLQSLSKNIPIAYATSITNEKGEWNTILPHHGGWVATFVSDSGQSVQFFKTSEIDSANQSTTILSPLTSIQGSFVDAAGNPLDQVSITLRGPNLQTSSDPNGNFTFTNIPHGNYILEYEIENNSTQFAMVTDDSKNRISVFPEPHLLLDDFNDGDQHPFIHNLLKDSRWVVWWDSASGIQVDPPVVSGAELTQAILLDHGITGNSFKINVTRDETSSSGMELVLNLGTLRMDGLWTEEEGHSFRSADSVVFWAKGQGDMILRMYVKDSLNPTEDMYKIQKSFMLNADWERFSIAFSDFVWKHNGNPVAEQWNQLKVYKFIFYKASNGALELDDISIKGIDILDLF